MNGVADGTKLEFSTFAPKLNKVVLLLEFVFAFGAVEEKLKFIGTVLDSNNGTLGVVLLGRFAEKLLVLNLISGLVLLVSFTELEVD